MKKYLNTLLVLLALVFLFIAIYYWVVPAGKLPHFVPGYEAGVTRAHFKHGLAALILAVGCIILVWFRSGKKASK